MESLNLHRMIRKNTTAPMVDPIEVPREVPPELELELELEVTLFVSEELAPTATVRQRGNQFRPVSHTLTRKNRLLYILKFTMLDDREGNIHAKSLRSL